MRCVNTVVKLVSKTKKIASMRKKGFTIFDYLKSIPIYWYVLVFAFVFMFVYQHFSVKMYADYPNVVTKAWFDRVKEQDIKAYKKSYNIILNEYRNTSKEISNQFLNKNEKAKIYFNGLDDYMMIKNGKIYMLYYEHENQKSNLKVRHWRSTELTHNNFSSDMLIYGTTLYATYFRTCATFDERDSLAVLIPIVGQIFFTDYGFDYNFYFFTQIRAPHFKPLLPHMLIHEYWRKVVQRLDFGVVDASVRDLSESFMNRLKEYSGDRKNTSVNYFFNYEDDLFYADRITYYQLFKNENKGIYNLYKVTIKLGNKIKVLNIENVL